MLNFMDSNTLITMKTILFEHSLIMDIAAQATPLCEAALDENVIHPTTRRHITCSLGIPSLSFD